MTTTFERVSVSTMRGMVAAAIRNAMLDGRLQPGERLVERKLAAEFGASLSVVREALVELETEGFIVKRRNTATFVTRISLEDAVKMFAMRGVLEPYAMSEAARKAKPEDIRDLRQIHERMCERASAGDFSGYLREDYTWHDRAWRIADNEYIRSALARALVPFFAFFAMRCPRPAFDLMEDAREHLTIMEGLAANDAEAVEKAVRKAMAEWRTRPEIYSEPGGAG